MRPDEVDILKHFAYMAELNTRNCLVFFILIKSVILNVDTSLFSQHSSSHLKWFQQAEPFVFSPEIAYKI